MKVALINTRIEPRQHVPMGLLYLAAAIEDICEVRVFDPEPDEVLLQDVFDFKPDVICITSMTQNWKHAKEIIDRFCINRSVPWGEKLKYKIVVGGIHATVATEEVKNTPGVDAVCVGEGEDWLRSYIFFGPNNYREDYKPPKVFDFSESTPAYHLMPDIEKYIDGSSSIRGTKTRSMNVMASRGCVGNCTYCSSKAMFGNKMKRRSVDVVITEIKMLKEKYGIIHISFSDDTFTASKKWFVLFCYKMLPLKIKWCCQSRADSLDEETVTLLSMAGCIQVDIGVESGSERLLGILHKGEFAHQIESAFALLKKYKIRRLATLVLGTPDEDENDITITKDFIRKIKPDFLQVFYLTPFPGTPLAKMCDEQGIKYNLTEYGIQDRPVIENPHISAERYIQIRNELLRINWWRNFKGYLTPTTFKWFITSLTPKNLSQLIKTWYRKSFYDATYEFLQRARRK